MDDGHNHLNGKLVRASTLGLIALFLFIVTMISAFALQISAPTAVNEGQPLAVSATGTGNITIQRSGIVVATGVGSATNTLLTNSSSAGIYLYTFTDANATDTRTIEVRDVPLEITVLSPAGTDVAASSVEFSLSTNLAPEMCYVNIDGVSHTLTATSPTTYTSAVPVSEGVHTIDYKCKLGSELAVASTTVHVDTTPPVVTAASPSGEVTGPYLMLSVNTDEIAQCRYGTTDAPYAALPSIMSTTYALRNTATVYAATYGSYTYFVRCTDVSGNAMTNATIISFLNNVPPAASISVDGNEPLKADTYHITLKSTQPLASMPVLTYNLQESGKQQQVALTGSGDTWTGFLIIPQGIADTVVGFSFSGTSQQGVHGTQITEGALFTIDASPPAAIDALSIENSSTQIKLKWFSTHTEEGATYNVYRADHEGVSYTDYYASTKMTEYVDTHASGARYFYYRIAPVDEAGNIGPLSQEVYGSALDQEIKGSTPALDPLLTARIDEEITSATSALLDANVTLQQLEQESNPVNIRIIKEMRLIDHGREGMLKVQSAMDLLTALRARSPSAEETDAGIAQARSLINDARHLLIRKLVAREMTDTKQPADTSGMERMLPYALLGQNLSTAERSAYLQKAIELQDRTTVALSAITFTLYDIAGQSNDYTLVRRTISLDNPQNDVTLIENIPKSIARDVADLEFSTQPVVLENDPVIEYKLGVLEHEEYTYVIKRLIPLSDVKTAQVFVYGPIEQKPEDLLTGQATRVGLPFNGSDTVLIIIGALIITGLGAYYVSLTKEPKQFKMAHARQKSVPEKIAPVYKKIVQAPLAAQPRLRESVGAETLLEQALSAINEKDYDAALRLYRDAVDAQKGDEGLQHMLHEQSSRVYARLLLFKRLTDAKDALEKKDPVGLRRALDDVRTTSKAIGDEQTRLMADAKASYASFVRMLNTLEIEQGGKY